jgi:beta-alanine degradation protein BauB
MPAARPTTTVDDDRVRITTWEFGDGDATGHHRHEYDYVVVPLTGGTFEVVNVDGSTATRTQEAGVAYVGSEGTEHDVINRSGRAASFIEIELKR